MLLVGGLTDEEQNNEHCYILDCQCHMKNNYLKVIQVLRNILCVNFTPGLHRLTVHLRNYCLPVNNPKTVLTKDTDSFQLIMVILKK